MKRNLFYGYLFATVGLALVLAGIFVLSKILSPELTALLLLVFGIILLDVGFAILINEPIVFITKDKR